MGTSRQHPAVGIVVITRDRRSQLLATLDRLDALPGRPPIVVVDNASVDGTSAAVRAGFPHVRLLRLPRNEGAVARNHGVALLDSHYVAFSDDDSWWEPEALPRAVAVFDAHPRLGLLSAATRVGADGQPDPLNTVLAASPLGTAPDLPGPSVLGFLACASVVRRAAFVDVGGFHPLLHFAGEEALLAIDLAARGWGVVHCPRVIARHVPDGGPRPDRAARVRRNELLTAYLRRPWSCGAALTALTARDALRDPYARLALAEALWRLPRALLHRKPVPNWLERDLRAVAAAAAPSADG
ncbi:glycosyltransferase family 2 protein [Streptantibioticus rubrisoli]|uniref:Glycosyltransferase n=1 Tax=Streptantibioticus rubrisoli TaxID=1387313 RepID=A0ABT1PMY7_9ACTN|nr:glycosyltransferase [Streptantibioticus rubrisoli]MCQ4046717.1 glycosyltransferase [Streptantibioticus rubrisoli]